MGITPCHSISLRIFREQLGIHPLCFCFLGWVWCSVKWCSCLLVVDFRESFVLLDSLSCRQCYSPNESCSNIVTECAEGSVSCVESLVNSTLGEWGCLHLWDLWQGELKRVGTRRTPELGPGCAVRLVGYEDDSPVTEVSRSCLAVQVQTQTRG